MSPLLINSGIGTNNINIPTVPAAATRARQQNIQQEPTIIDDKIEDEEEAREERKATGRSIAIIIFLALMCLALYHVVQKKTTILAGVLVPAMILFSYTFFVIHISQKDKKKRRKQLDSNDPELSVTSVGPEKTLSIPNPSISSAGTMPSTSAGLNATRPLTKIVDPRLAALRTANLHHPLTHKASSSSLQQFETNPQSAATSDRKKPFKKAQSHSHIQIVNKSGGTNISGNIQPSAAKIAIQHETKKLKKSRSFDKNNYPMDVQQKQHKRSHVTDKRPKQQQNISNKV